MRLSDWKKHVEEMEKGVKSGPAPPTPQENPAPKPAPPVSGAVPRPAAPAEAAPVPGAAAGLETSSEVIARPVEAPKASAQPPSAAKAPAPETRAQSQAPPTAPASDEARQKPAARTANLQIPEFEDFVSFLREPAGSQTHPAPSPESAPAKPHAPARQPDQAAAPRPAKDSTSEQKAQAAPAAPAAPPKPEASRPDDPRAGSDAPKPVAPAPATTTTKPRRKVARRATALSEIEAREVAQNSYKRSFEESREDLVQRLVDPILSLEDTARLLGVCPTTVRRYTNRGLLACLRTVGNQRRFRLSDVVAFMKAQSPEQESPAAPGESASNNGN